MKSKRRIVNLNNETFEPLYGIFDGPDLYDPGRFLFA